VSCIRAVHLRARTSAEHLSALLGSIPSTSPSLKGFLAYIFIYTAGPCGDFNCTLKCMTKTGSCCNDFPKGCSEFTTLDDNGFFNYKRPEGGIQVDIRARTSTGGYATFTADNSWVVPYNGVLCFLCCPAYHRLMHPLQLYLRTRYFQLPAGFLMQKYNCHLNVEVTTGAGSLRYDAPHLSLAPLQA
jgi:hypothetical protein